MNFASGPWHLKQFSLKIGRMSLLKSIFLGALVAFWAGAKTTPAASKISETAGTTIRTLFIGRFQF
jgi:hypothetical protein